MIDFGNGLTDVSPWHHYCSSQPTGSPESWSPLYSHNTKQKNNAKLHNCIFVFYVMYIYICAKNIFLNKCKSDQIVLSLSLQTEQQSGIFVFKTSWYVFNELKQQELLTKSLLAFLVWSTTCESSFPAAAILTGGAWQVAAKLLFNTIIQLAAKI